MSEVFARYRGTLLKSFRFIVSVPSSVPIIPVRLPGREIMLRTICVLEGYASVCKSLLDLQIQKVMHILPSDTSMSALKH